jgi:hypothetical protein
MIKVVDAEVIFISKFGEIKRWWLLHQKIFVIIKDADPEVMFIEKIWNDPNNIQSSTVACWLRSAPINNCFDQS